MKTPKARHFLMPVLISGLGLILGGRVPAQTLTTLYNFTATIGHNLNGSPINPEGATPLAGLILSDGTLYGTASAGGGFGWGTLFAFNIDTGSLTKLHAFTGGSDGNSPSAGLILSGTVLYGTAFAGGAVANYQGTVFRVNIDGTGFTNLHSFNGSDGAFPRDRLVLSGTTLYGTAYAGGSSGVGTVFAVNTDGTGFAKLHDFTPTSGVNATGTNSDGASPGGLILLGTSLYGTAFHGGSCGNGTVFAVNTDGTEFTNLHTFTASSTNSSGVYTNSDGASPYAGLLLSNDSLYGTTVRGGPSGMGTVFKVNIDGTGFTNLHSFSGSEGALPQAVLILSGNTLYGTTYYGGSSGNGTVFAVNSDGTGFATLHSFTGGSDGYRPVAELVLSGNILYGTASDGGSSGNGTVFSLLIRPQLTVVLSGPNVTLAWPTNATGFKLHSTTNLASSAVWTTNVPAPVIVNGQNVVTNPISGSQQFYRLVGRCRGKGAGLFRPSSRGVARMALR